MFGLGSLKYFAKRTFNISEWANQGLLIKSGKSIWQLYDYMRASKPERVETFEQAMQRLRLSEQDVQQRLRYYRRTMSLYGVVFIASFLYTLLMLRVSQWLTGFSSIAYCALVFSFFFRESFWYMQIKKRCFGLTIRDWLRFVCRCFD